MTARAPTPRGPASCRFIREHLDAYLDGELDPSLHVEFDRHVDGCARCGDETAFRESFRAQLQAAVSGPRCPPALRQRIVMRLDDVDRGTSGIFTYRREPQTGATPLRVPAAATAVLAAAGLTVLLASPAHDDGDRAEASMLGRIDALPDLLEGAVQVHRADLPADVRSNRPDQLERFVRPRVPFAAPPVRLDGARPYGARLVIMNGRRVPAYYYRRPDGRQVTVLVVDVPGPAQRLRAPRVVSRRVAGQPVQVLERGDRTYVLTGDLPERELARLAVGARLP